MFTTMMIAASRQLALGGMAMYRFNGLLLDHTVRLTFLHMKASAAYMELGLDHLESHRHLHDPNAFAVHMHRHHQVLEAVSRGFSRETASLTGRHHGLTGGSGADIPENVISFAAAVREREENQRYPG